MFTSLGDGTYCLVGEDGRIYNDPVAATGNKRVTALFVSRMFGTNNVIDYWKFVIKHKNPLNPPLFLKLQGVEYEFQ